MQSAALILLALELGLASSMSVLFGWQPMPDGSAKIEYIVQLEPELVATLQAGQSIPITSDIPDDLGPIGRIRIVVGRGDLPQQKLATQFKPWPQQTLPEKQPPAGPEKQPRSGLVETQYTVPPVETTGSGRYDNRAAANNEILPPSGATAANPFGRALQQGAEQARNLAAEAGQQILPPADQLFGAGGGGSQAVQNAIGNTTNQMRQGFQQGVERVADQTGQQMRQAVDNMGQRALEAVDQFGRSNSPQRSVIRNSNGDNGQNQSSATILPPDSPPRGQVDNGQVGNGQFASKGQRIDQPINDQRPDSWSATPPNFAAESAPERTNPTGQPGRFDAPWPTAASNPAAGRYGDRAIEPPAAAAQWPSDRNGRDVFDVANRDSDISPPGLAATRQPGYNPTQSGTPNSGAPQSGIDGPQLSQPTQQSSQQLGTAPWPANPTTPEVRGYMLESDQQTAGSIAGRGPVAGQQGYQPPAAQSRFATGSYDAGNYDAGNYGSGNNGSGSSNSKSLFPLLLSWVLLSGSGAGNLYLFWSYLDVRSKYHGVVHGSPRRRQHYDDD